MTGIVCFNHLWDLINVINAFKSEISQLTGKKKHEQGALSGKPGFAYLIYEHLR